MNIHKITIPAKFGIDLAKATAMLICDGSMPLKHNGEGKRNYQLCFYNSNKKIVIEFAEVIEENFGLKGKITKRVRKSRKPIYDYSLYSKNVCEYFNEIGVPYGKKSGKVIVPDIINKSSNEIKKAFLEGVIVTDACVKPYGGIMFHCASFELLEGINKIVNEIAKKRDRRIKEYKQGKFTSYQLYLNNNESKFLL